MKHVISALVLALFFVGGCTHKISIKPNSFEGVGSGKINSQCAIVIPQSKIDLETIEGGRSGDKYQYYPYKDLRYGMAVILKNVCQGVTFCTSVEEASDSLVPVAFVPTITTKSTAGFFLWPPETFDVDLYVTVDVSGEGVVQTVTGSGQGTADFGQMTKNAGHSGSVALQKSLQDIINKLDYNLINGKIETSNTEF